MNINNSNTITGQTEPLPLIIIGVTFFNLVQETWVVHHPGGSLSTVKELVVGQAWKEVREKPFQQLSNFSGHKPRI